MNENEVNEIQALWTIKAQRNFSNETHALMIRAHRYSQRLTRHLLGYSIITYWSDRWDGLEHECLLLKHYAGSKEEMLPDLKKVISILSQELPRDENFYHEPTFRAHELEILGNLLTMLRVFNPDAKEVRKKFFTEEAKNCYRRAIHFYRRSAGAAEATVEAMDKARNLTTSKTKRRQYKVIKSEAERKGSEAEWKIWLIRQELHDYPILCNWLSGFRDYIVNPVFYGIMFMSFPILPERAKQKTS